MSASTEMTVGAWIALFVREATRMINEVKGEGDPYCALDMPQFHLVVLRPGSRPSSLFFQFDTTMNLGCSYYSAQVRGEVLAQGSASKTVLMQVKAILKHSCSGDEGTAKYWSWVDGGSVSTEPINWDAFSVAPAAGGNPNETGEEPDDLVPTRPLSQPSAR